MPAHMPGAGTFRHRLWCQVGAMRAVAGTFADIPWRKVAVGQVLRVADDELFPADLLCLHSALPDGVCFIRTTNLDGETNLKIRRCCSGPATATGCRPHIQHRLQCACFSLHLLSAHPAALSQVVVSLPSAGSDSCRSSMRSTYPLTSMHLSLIVCSPWAAELANRVAPQWWGAAR